MNMVIVITFIMFIISVIVHKIVCSSIYIYLQCNWKNHLRLHFLVQLLRFHYFILLLVRVSSFEKYLITSFTRDNSIFMQFLLANSGDVHLLVTCAVEQAIVYWWVNFYLRHIIFCNIFSNYFVIFFFLFFLPNIITCDGMILYSDIIKNLLNYPIYLTECMKYDSVLCSHIMDVDWDGRNEIIIGTYGREMLIYKQG